MKIIQFSDIHLFKNPHKTLLNINTDASFRSVLNAARRNGWPPDLVLVTGDMSQDGSRASYRRLSRLLRELKVPVYCLPGNHDAQPLMHYALRAPNIHMDRQILHGKWNIILLDSTIPKSNNGRLPSSELAFLKKCLKNYPHHYALISFHHNPIPSGSKWLDQMIVKNARKLFEIIDRNRQVRGVLFGHVHQAFFEKRKGVVYAAGPATCIQFKPKCAGFKLDSIAPGYQIVSLGTDGTIKTRIKRIRRSPFKPDLSSEGY